MKLSLSFSPCPNDTFIFGALINKKIDTGIFDFDVLMADVEELNLNAMQNNVDITKLSYNAYAHVFGNYKLLQSGSALGRGNGPLLISKRKIYPDEVKYLKIAVPGEYTTANLLLGIAYPNATNKVNYLFSDIEEAVLSDEVDAGTIIHENRFTYKSKGLRKIIDLGEYWEKEYKQPIPLGGIVINRKFDNETQREIQRLIKESIEYAYNNISEIADFIKNNAQEMKEEVIKKHINLYVNNYTKELGQEGRDAILELYKAAFEKQIIKKIPEDIFCE